MCKKWSLKLADKRMAPKSSSLINGTQKKENIKYTDKRAKIVTYWIHLYNQDGYAQHFGYFSMLWCRHHQLHRTVVPFTNLKKKDIKSSF